MSQMIWEESYSVKIPSIDEQHKKMFKTVNQMQAAICGNAGKAALERMFKEMNDYAKTHFRTEEEYFEKYSYEDKDKHIAEHNAYKQQLAAFEKALEENKELDVYARYLSVEVMKFLRKWWVDHVCNEDKKYMNALSSEQKPA